MDIPVDNGVWASFFNGPETNKPLALCADGHYVLMVNYLTTPINQITQELKAIQKSYNLGHIFIFQIGTLKHHVICFSKISYNELRDILDQIHCENRHVKDCIMNVTTAEAPKLVKVLRASANWNDRLNSSAHMINYMKSILPVDMAKVYFGMREDIWDKQTELLMGN